MWLHLLGLLIALSSTLKKKADWNRLFLVCCSIGGLFALTSFMGEIRLGDFVFAGKGSSTLGNSSFLGSYLLFISFLSFWLFSQNKKPWVKTLTALICILSVLSIYYAGARAATLALLGGYYLIFLMFLSFKVNKKAINYLGRILLILSFLFVLVASVMLFVPDTFVRTKFVELASRARFVNWEMALKGFSERPMLGWGPENYTVLFPKFFNSCLFTPECGGEIWFDRTHNIVLDTLSTTGIIGLLSYLSLFVGSFYLLIKKYFKEKNISFWTFAVFIALPIAYFVQNLTVFDMPVSLMMFILVLSLFAFLSQRERQEEQSLGLKHKWFGYVAVILFLICISEFVIQPLRTDYLTISAIQTMPSGEVMEQVKANPEQGRAFLEENSKQRIEFYKKALASSAMGKYQIRDFFAQRSQQFIKENIEEFSKQTVSDELMFVISEVEKSKVESPLDYRSYLKLAQLYNLYFLVDDTALIKAEEYGNKAMEVSPENQQSYWVLAQTKLYQKKVPEALSLAKQAIELEPNWLQSYSIAYQIASFVEDKEAQEEIKQKAIEINLEWGSSF